MKIESLLFPWSTERQNEDHIYVWTDTFAVFDGASSLIPFQDSRGKTGWFLASEIARDTFKLLENTGYSLAEMFDHINKKIFKKMQSEGINTSQKEALWCTTAAAVRIHDTQVDFVQITDAIILAIYKDGTYKELWKNSDHDRETLVEWKNLWNISQKEKRKKVNDTVIKKRQEQNISYWVLSGESEYKDFLQIWSIHREGLAHILLFTDGLMPCKANPGESDDYTEMVQVFLASWISGVYSWIHTCEESDPECILYPRFKKHDDVWVISINF